MSEKRYITEKYVWCTCKKHQEVCVGMKYYKYTNILILPFILVFVIALMASSSKDWYMPVTALGIALFLILVPRSYYVDAKKDMLKEGHSKECSEKIAKLVVLHAGMWSNFRIMRGNK